MSTQNQISSSFLKTVFTSIFLFVVIVVVSAQNNHPDYSYSKNLIDAADERYVWHYKGSEQPRRTLTKGVEQFYDKKGNLLGALELKYENLTSLPWKGTRFIFDEDNESVKSTISYSAGNIVEKINFNKRLVSGGVYKIFKEVLRYCSDGYNKEKYTSFYSYGKKQSEIIYKDGVKVIGKFFDKRGTEIGVYDYVEKSGTCYDFFKDSDNVKRMKTFKNNTLIKSKLFIQTNNPEYDRIQPILVHEFDINCCEKYYTDKGLLLGELTYKNKKPWTGITFNKDNDAKFTIKNGLRNGAYEMQNTKGEIAEKGQFKNDLKEGLFEYYSPSNYLVKSETYVDGLLHGVAITYNNNGEEISRMIYDNGVALNGTLLSKTMPNSGKKVSNFREGKECETIVYYKDSDQKKLKYSVQNTSLDGDVIRYDENGIQLHRAELVNGKLVSGTILLRPVDTKREIRNIKMSKDGENLTLEFYDLNGVVTFVTKENLTMNTNYISRLNENLKSLKPYRLY